MTTQDPIRRLSARVVPREAFDADLLNPLWDLYARYYAPTDRAVFEADFRAKDWAIVLSDADGRDVGFSTIAERLDTLAGQRIRTLFSGDTIIERSHWGEQTLPYRWVELAGAIKARDPATPLYWLLISKGHRTYRLMPGFTFRHYPNPTGQTPAPIRDLMDHLGRTRFGPAYDATTGIVRAGALPTRLRPEVDGAGEGAARNAHIRFFASRNPGHTRGDELLCLCELTPENLRPRARAHLLRGLAGDA